MKPKLSEQALKRKKKKYYIHVCVLAEKHTQITYCDKKKLIYQQSMHKQQSRLVYLQRKL